jgi:uncharacterized protein (DUF1697 family)
MVIETENDVLQVGKVPGRSNYSNLENQYLTLLRGINVGGNNIIKMTDLKSCFEDMGFSDVVTYIQSGNVLFKSDEKDKIRLTNKIEKVLSEKFNYSSRIVVITYTQLKRTVVEAPDGFGKEADQFRYDVIYLKEPLIAQEMITKLKPREGVDSVYTGDAVLYFSRLIIKASQSRMSKIITLPEYQNVTIRNWNTTTKLLELMEK